MLQCLYPSMKKYFIAYLLEGEARDWHNSLTKQISERFGTTKLYEKFPPHITICRPFSREDVDDVCERIEEWQKNFSRAGTFAIRDFGYFDDRVVFVKAEPDVVVRREVDALRKILAPLLPPEDYPVWNPHTTLANYLNPEQKQTIWDFVQTLPKPDFTVLFSNIALLELDETSQKYRVHKMFS